MLFRCYHGLAFIILFPQKRQQNLLYQDVVNILPAWFKTRVTEAEKKRIRSVFLQLLLGYNRVENNDLSQVRKVQSKSLFEHVFYENSIMNINGLQTLLHSYEVS